VRLTVTSDAHRRWIAMVDPLPAGLEAVNPRLVTSAGTGSTQPWYWAHHELRDDRVAWFADWMPAGSFVLSYQARATIDGTFAVAPAHVEAMYQPEVMGRTAMTSFVVRK
jgi:alpha-2-macroglobulin